MFVNEPSEQAASVDGGPSDASIDSLCGKEGRTRREALVLSRGHWELNLFVIFFFFYYLIEQ